MAKEVTGYNDFRIAVPQAFEDVFSHFYFAENTSGKTITKTLLPSYQTILIFCFGEKVQLVTQNNVTANVDKCFVLGPVKQAFQYIMLPRCKILAANFKEDAFYRFFGDPSVIKDLYINPDDLLNENCFTILWHELNNIEDITQRVSHILAFSEPYLKKRNDIAQQLVEFSDKNSDPVKSIAQENNQSQRNIQLAHKKVFGFSAREINRYQRFLKAIELVNTMVANNKKADWIEVSETCGYYDQSQLIHDFKHYLHISPTKYLKFQQGICNPVH